MYGCDSWAIKAEHPRIDAFELWCWRRLLRVPWTARRSDQSILKEISQSRIFTQRTDAEAPIFWLPDAKSWLTRKNTDAGWQRLKAGEGMTEDKLVASLTMDMSFDIRNWWTSTRWWRTGKPGMLQYMGSQGRTQLSVWTPPPLYQILQRK